MDINDAWIGACRVVLGGEVGGLEQFAPYLTKYIESPVERVSALSGHALSVSFPSYPAEASFISNDEMARYNQMKKARLDINQVKDIDSVLEALREQIIYSGNIVIGNSREVSESDSIANSQFVHRSVRIYDSKYVAYSSDVRYGDHVFGCDKGPAPKFMISSTHTHKSVRGFENIKIIMASDAYYCANLEECQNCLFTFNQKSRRHLISNCQFAPDEYAKLKAKLLEDVRSRLEQKKSVPSIVDILRGSHE